MYFLASKGSSSWILSLVCNDLSKASGGCNRSLQIYEILAGNGWLLKPVKHDKFESSSPAKTVLGALKSISRHGAYSPFCVDSIRAQGRNYCIVQGFLEAFPNVIGIIMEGTGYGALSSLGEWKRAGKKIVLVPHNIESLATNLDAWTHKGIPVAQRFRHEQKWLAIADLIFTISVEESWWLGLHEINSLYLPYYPPGQRRSVLESVRMRRKPDDSTGWLYVADFNNPPNRLGARLALDWLSTIPNPPRSLLVAGRGCDWFASKYASILPAYCTVIGEVSDEVLADLYSRCAAQLIVHPPTSGMLTRVIDAALAGIPVVGNDMALKGYSLLFDRPGCPAKPSYPDSYVQRFLYEIEKFC